MSDVVLEACAALDLMAENAAPGKHIVTGDIRRLSGKLWRGLENRSATAVFSLCEALLERRTWECGVIAFDWAWRVRSQYDEGTYPLFFGWLKEYVRGWGDCDDFCTHAFGALVRSRRNLFGEVLKWTQDDDFWVRRASAVVLIPSILHDDFAGIFPFQISDALLGDSCDLVQKGCGWMLKCLSTVDSKGVRDYLISRRDRMSRTAFRYAVEKFDAPTRRFLMEL